MLEISELENLCIKLDYLLQQDSHELSQSLKGDILDAYERLVQTDADSVWEIRRRLITLEEDNK